MPNWASTEIYIYHEDKTLITEIQNKILRFSSVLASEKMAPDCSWLGNIVMHATGCTYEDVLNEKYGYPRSWIQDIGSVEQCNNYFVFTVQAECAWLPKILPWRHILDHLSPHKRIKMAWVSTEPGMELYLKYDSEDVFLRDYEYEVDCYVPDNELWDRYPELLDEHRAYTAAELLAIFGKQDMDGVIRRAEEITEAIQNECDGDGFYNISRYETVEDEY